MLFRAWFAKHERSFGDRKISPDEVTNQIADTVKVAVVIPETQPIKEAPVACAVSASAIDVTNLQVA